MEISGEDEGILRNQICEIGTRLWRRQLIAANDGNISVRLGAEALLCTPSGISKGFLKSDNLVVTDLHGQKISGAFMPSSELKMHVEIYRRRPAVMAILHAHPPHATAFAVAGLEMPKYVMPEIDVLLGAVPIIPYETPGTQRLADAIGEAVGAKGHDTFDKAFILQNHGAVVCGATLEMAWLRMESLDQCCKILLLASQAGGWRQIPDNQRMELDALRISAQTA